MSLWSVKTQRIPFQHCKDARRVYGHTKYDYGPMHDMRYLSPAPTPTPSLLPTSSILWNCSPPLVHYSWLTLRPMKEASHCDGTINQLARWWLMKCNETGDTMQPRWTEPSSTLLLTSSGYGYECPTELREVPGTGNTRVNAHPLGGEFGLKWRV